ncbi:hypothetical protein BDW22DRAFT_182672 [Trametopsis cervina]|nr:hypothetical protein BDW22DRAFT_182672 [Trametopsis cervina]
MNRVVLNDLPEVSQVLGEVPRNTAILNDLPKVSQVLGEVPLKDDPTSSDPGRLSPGIANSPQASPRDSKGECIAFILGHCPRGDLCPYPHIPPGPAECRPFKAGLCYRYNCPLQHVPLREICLKYQRGECTWGKRCRRLHTLEEVTDRAEPPKAKNAETKVGENTMSYKSTQNDITTTQTSQFSCDAGRAITKEQMAAFKNTEHQMHLDVKSSAAINLQEEYVKISEDIRDPRSLILRVAHDSDGKPVYTNGASISLGAMIYAGNI